MRRMAGMILGVLTLGSVLGLVRANTVLSENGYEGVVVAIGEEVPEDPNIITNLKKMFTDGSLVLYEATRRRAYFREVTIVVPSTWNSSEHYMKTQGSGYVSGADVRVDLPHPIHADDPYTLQLGGCGEPGAYVHLSPTYAASMYSALQHTYGPPGKVLVHEWAHLRWGVFDEYGEHGTITPAFYIGEDMQVHATGCTDSIKGWLRKTDGSECHADISGMPNSECHFFPADHLNNATASLMYLYFLDSVKMFCDNDPMSHNPYAPNAQNLQCDGRSVWEIITLHKDFRDGANPSRQKRDADEDLMPKFQVIQEEAKEKPRFVLLLDLSGSMDQFMNQLYQAVVRFVRDLVPTGSLLAVVSFANTSRLDLNFTVVPENRDYIVSKLPNTYTDGGYTAIGGALEFILQLVEDTRTNSKGLMVVLITDGDETMHPKVETKLPAIKKKGIIINTVSFGPNATDSLELWAKETGGRSYYHSTGSTGSLSSLDALLFDSITKDLDQRGDQLLQPGRWKYIISNTPRNHWPHRDEVVVAVTSHPNRKTRQDPVRVKAWMSANNITYPEPALVYAYVSQGYSMVLDANVTAVIVPPTEEESISFPLLDNGVGADVRAGDGIYSAYFTQYSGNGRYSLSAIVSTSDLTARLQGTPSGSAEAPQRPGTSALRRLTLPQTVMLPEPESNFPPGQLVPLEDPALPSRNASRRLPLEPFTRFTSGGIFKVHNYQPGDQQPPGRVTDLTVSYVYLYDALVSLTWTSPGDDLYSGTASSLELRYHETMRFHNNFHLGHPVNSSHLTSGDLTPRPAGEQHNITLKILGRTVDNLEGKAVFFVLRARDEKGNSGNMSNIATAYFPLKKYTRNIQEEQKMEALSGLVVLVVLAVIILVIVAFIASVKLLHNRNREKRREQQLVEGGHAHRFFS
nr:calcium-activated chloride channel regulator 3A-1-like isoform X1 [Procambarus clarkii]